MAKPDLILMDDVSGHVIAFDPENIRIVEEFYPHADQTVIWFSGGHGNAVPNRVIGALSFEEFINRAGMWLTIVDITDP